jgi:hypothetical protein
MARDAWQHFPVLDAFVLSAWFLAIHPTQARLCPFSSVASTTFSFFPE